MVTGHMEGGESTDVLSVHFRSTPQQRGTGRALVIAQGCKHKWGPTTLVQLVHPIHHDQLSDHGRTLPYRHSHVEGVWVVNGAAGEERSAIRK